MARAARRRRPEPPRQLHLPALAPFDGELEPYGDLEDVALADLDLTGARAEHSALRSCRLERCRLDEATFADGRITECVLAETGASALDVGGGTWRDVIVESPRIGALSAVRADWSSVRIRGGRIDFLVLAGARLDTVAFEDCSIGELDLGDARLRNVTFERCPVDVLDVEAALLADVDLTGATLKTVRGVGALRGATVSTAQLVELGPLLADHLGINVRDAEPDWD